MSSAPPKRNFSESESRARDDAAGDDSRPPKRQKKRSHKAREGTVNWTKKRARTIERQFRHKKDIPANVQNDLERELAAHKGRLDERDFERKRKSMIKKYHMLRFFERKKAQKLGKQLEERLKTITDPAEAEQVRADLRVARVDEAYARYFPYMEKYVSLYPDKPKAGSAEDEAAKKSKAARSLQGSRPPLWSMVEKTMEKGEAALAQLRERRLGVDFRAKPPPQRPSKHSFAAKAGALGKKKAKEEDRGAKREEGAGPSTRAKEDADEQRDEDGGSDGESSDGGFFE